MKKEKLRSLCRDLIVKLFNKGGDNIEIRYTKTELVELLIDTIGNTKGLDTEFIYIDEKEMINSEGLLEDEDVICFSGIEVTNDLINYENGEYVFGEKLDMEELNKKTNLIGFIRNNK